MSQVITSDSVRINYEEMGQGEPALLFMPGWCSKACYSELPLKCSNNRRVLTFDWRGYGQSETPENDYGANDMFEDALAVIEASGAERIIPVTYAHSGWIAVELRRKLGERIPKIVDIGWAMVVPPPQEYMNLLEGLAEPEKWQQSLEQLFKIWLDGESNPNLVRFFDEMGAYGTQRWMRTGREIASSYAQWGSPLQALSSLNPPVSVLHIFSLLKDNSAYLKAQESFAADNAWFKFHPLSAPAHTHFPMFEVPDQIAAIIEKFVA